MKKISILLVLLFVGLMIMNVQQELDSKVVFSDLALENIEALAEGEIEDGVYHCYGSGDVDCPQTDHKSAYVYGPLGLD